MSQSQVRKSYIEPEGVSLIKATQMKATQPTKKQNVQQDRNKRQAIFQQSLTEFMIKEH